MAKIVYEKRQFTDRNTGIVTEYDYIAIAGTDERSINYEVALKNMVQSEKMALRMIADAEGTTGDVTTRKANGSETPQVTRSSNLLDDEDGKGLFD